MILDASKQTVFADAAPQPSAKARQITRALVPGGPEPITNGLGNLMPLTVVSSVGMVSVNELRLRQRTIRFRPPITKELPCVANFANHVQVHVGDHDVGLRSLFACGDELPARITEITLPIELADVPRLLVAGPIDRADKVLIGNRMSRLLELP